MTAPATGWRSRSSSEVPSPKALEERAEIDSLEILQAERRKLLKDYAPLAAKFKGGATAGTDAARKRHRALVAKRILADMKENWGKTLRPGEVVGVWKEPAETALERMANADIEHIAFCEKLESDYMRFILLENDIQEVNEKIRSREVELYSYNAELRMQS